MLSLATCGAIQCFMVRKTPLDIPVGLVIGISCDKRKPFAYITGTYINRIAKCIVHAYRGTYLGIRFCRWANGLHIYGLHRNAAPPLVDVPTPRCICIELRTRQYPAYSPKKNRLRFGIVNGYPSIVTLMRLASVPRMRTMYYPLIKTAFGRGNNRRRKFKNIRNIGSDIRFLISSL